MPSSTKIGFVWDGGREVSAMPPWSMPTSTMTEPGRILCSSARELHFGELHDGRGTRTVALLLGIDPSLLPRTDFFKAAKRYTG